MKLRQKILISFLAFIVFAISLRPVTTYDTFFGIKIGELVIKTQQIPSKEIFSWSAYNRDLVAYEWLPQTLIYILNTLGGLQALEIYVALMFVGFFISFALILNKIIKRDFVFSLCLSMLAVASIYEYFVARPQIIAFVLYLLTISLICHFLLNKRNYLILSLFITYIWTNSHASFIFVPFLFFSVALLKRSRTLFIFGLLNTLVTISPPLYFGPYKLLFDFSKDINFLTKFITEWAPLSSQPLYQVFYLIMLIMSIVIILLNLKRNHWKISNELVIALPLLIIILFSSQAVRHIPFTAISTILIIGLLLPSLSFNLLVAGIFALFVSFLLYTKINIGQSQIVFPDNSIRFLLDNHLNGKMYNDFAVGGYLIYALYPKYQVFFDGRADIYHKYELPDYWALVEAKKVSRSKFIDKLHYFLNKYQFSFATIGVDSYDPLKLSASTFMADTLLNDPDWKLIYFDDQSQIFLKNDHLNDVIFNSMGKANITPFRLTFYKIGKEVQAQEEYQKMIQVQDSGIARTGLGEVFLSLGQTDKASLEFNKAIELNPMLSPSYIGLAKIALLLGKSDEAVNFSYKAISLTPDIGQFYLILAEAFINSNRKDQAKSTLSEALKRNIDLISRQKIIQLLNSLNR